MLSFVAIGCACPVIILFGFYLYNRLKIRMCTNTNSLEGKTVLVTGGNSGIGFEAAKEFARRGARLVLPCRNQKKAHAAIAEIIKETGNKDIKLYRLDTSSLQSVEDFAKELMSGEDIKIDILCLNAGAASAAKRTESVDGFEYLFATNHLGHFHLTNLIRPLLTSSARIIITSSYLHHFCWLDFSDLQQEKRFSPTLSYCRSKLMNICYMRELASRLSGTGITVNAVHPGMVRTGIFGGPFGSSIPIWTMLFANTIVRLYGRTVWQAAQTMIHLATCDKLQGVTGTYFEDCKPQRFSRLARSEEVTKKLWEYSEQKIAEWKNKHGGS